MISGEVHCLTCGRYLADITEGEGSKLRLLPVYGHARHQVELRQGKPFCRHCGGRAFVEYDVVRGFPVQRRAA
ncbi:MAG: hypothetical protein ACYDCQ_22120 [Dehalococcoidia bacterium]